MVNASSGEHANTAIFSYLVSASTFILEGAAKQWAFLKFIRVMGNHYNQSINQLYFIY